MKDQPDFTLLITHPSADEYAALVREHFPEVRVIAETNPAGLEECIAEADALLGFHFPVEHLHRAVRLRWFQSTGAGVDSIIPVRERVGHITVTNVRGIQGDLIADYVMGGVTLLHWDFRQLLRAHRERSWATRTVAPLADLTLGVIGLGAVGMTIARRAKSAGMTVLGSKQNIAVPVDSVDRVFGSGRSEVTALLAASDFVVLAVPSTKETVGLIGARELAAMRRTAFLINVARGNVVVETELVEALRSGAIAGAMLDVFEREPLPPDSALWDLPKVIVTPHMSGVPSAYVKRAFGVIAENIRRFLNKEPLTNVVSLDRGY